MPNTLIREGYLDSDRVSALSDFDDRVFFRVLLAADDAGRTDGRVDKLRSALFPTRENVRSVDIEKAVARLISAGLLSRWEWDGKPFIQVMRWQRRSGAQYSKFPGPDGSFRIAWVEIETRDGKQAFSSTSLNGSATHRKPIDNPSEGVVGKSTETETETETKAQSVSEADGFLAVWSAAPPIARDRSSRKKCLGVWRKLRLESRTPAILAALEAWKSSPQWQREKGQFIPGLHRWLGEEKFGDTPSNGENGHDPLGESITPTAAEVRARLGGKR